MGFISSPEEKGEPHPLTKRFWEFKKIKGLFSNLEAI